MDKAICNTGPILHLSEIGQAKALNIFSHLYVPASVAEELRSYGCKIINTLPVKIASVSEEQQKYAEALLNSARAPDGGPLLGLHPADMEVIALALNEQFKQYVVLTDDLALQRALEASGATVVGTVGILIRAYKSGIFDKTKLYTAIEALFFQSTLFISRAFRTYLYQLLAELLEPGADDVQRTP